MPSEEVTKCIHASSNPISTELKDPLRVFEVTYTCPVIVFSYWFIRLTKLLLFRIFSRFGTEIGLYVKTGKPAACFAKVNVLLIEIHDIHEIRLQYCCLIELQSC